VLEDEAATIALVRNPRRTYSAIKFASDAQVRFITSFMLDVSRKSEWRAQATPDDKNFVLRKSYIHAKPPSSLYFKDTRLHKQILA
jgi:hypothetical protein